MTKTAVVCMAHGSEEMESVTIIDLLTRANIDVTTASVEPDGALLLTCSHGVHIVADTTLIAVADKAFDVVILPGGLPGAQTLSESALLVEMVRQQQLDGKLVAAICASPALVLEKHHLYPVATMTGYPSTQQQFSANKWVDKRVCYDERVHLITSQGPATAIDFSLKIIACLQGKEIAAKVAAELVLPPGIYNYQDN